MVDVLETNREFAGMANSACSENGTLGDDCVHPHSSGHLQKNGVGDACIKQAADETSRDCYLKVDLLGKIVV